MEHNPIGTLPTLALALGALNLVRDLALDRPDLPAADFNVSTYADTTYLVVQARLETFDVWRAALQLKTDEVRLYPVAVDSSHLSVVAVKDSAGDRRLSVKLFAGGLPRLEERQAAEDTRTASAEDITAGMVLADSHRTVTEVHTARDGWVHWTLDDGTNTAPRHPRCPTPVVIARAPSVSAGELAEQAHLLDPHDHAFEALVPRTDKVGPRVMQLRDLLAGQRAARQDEQAGGAR
ncbi:hypothetical protein ACFVDH_30615 [Streptomyces sp. NPDC057674]|uniref:hypothetical protein n=1 Tax=Streptomyces sp. NPDC057674 TaxID=3346203 RepID=UPI0036B74A6E